MTEPESVLREESLELELRQNDKKEAKVGRQTDASIEEGDENSKNEIEDCNIENVRKFILYKSSGRNRKRKTRCFACFGLLWSLTWLIFFAGIIAFVVWLIKK